MAATASRRGLHSSGPTYQEPLTKIQPWSSASAVRYNRAYVGEKTREESAGTFQFICSRWVLERGVKSSNSGRAEEYFASSSPKAAQSMTRQQPGAGNRKRRIAPGDDFEGDDSGTDDGDEDEHRSAKRSKRSRNHPSRTFACPYSKYDAARYSSTTWRSCPDSGWSSISRIKEHIYRNHLLKKCSRCCESFPPEELSSHQRAEPACTLKPLDTHNPSNELRKRIQDGANRGTEAQRWYALWDILFPDTPAPASPYCEDPGGGEFHDASGSPRSESSGSHPTDIRNLDASSTSEGEDRPPPQPSLSRVLRGIEPKLWSRQSSEDDKLLLSKIIMSIDIWLAFRQNEHQQDPKSAASETDGDQQDEPPSGPESTNLVRSLPSGNRRNTDARSNRKRNRLPDDLGGEGDGENGDGGGSKRPRMSGTEVLGFACPFRKRFPLIYGIKKECMGWWPNVHRLKEHLYRKHLQPISCARCSETFPNQESLEAHQRTPIPCVVGERRAIEGIQPSQERLLRSKKKMGNTEYEKCRAVYKMIWPEMTDEEVPCPYWNLSEAEQQPLPDQSSETEQLNKYEQFLAGEMPGLLGTLLEDELRRHGIVSKERILSLVNEAQTKLFHQFRSAGSANPSASSLAAVAAEPTTKEPKPAVVPGLSMKGLQRQEPFDFDLDVPPLSIPDPNFADLDVAGINAYFDQYIGNGGTGHNGVLSDREVAGVSSDKNQYRFMELPEQYLPMTEGYGTGMLFQDVEL